MSSKMKTCNKCCTEFHVRSTYYKHIKKCKGEKISDKPLNYLCLEENCCFASKFSLDLVNHLQNVHKMDIPLNSQNFQEYHEFKSWKENFERISKSSFYFRSSRENKNGKVEYFYCNRSGYYESVENPQRAHKSQGSNKLGFNCPAFIKILVEDTGKISATVCPFHYGHDHDLSHIPIPKRDQEEIAAQLVIGVPHHRVLRNIFDGEVQELERKHLCNKQDVLNISKKYGTDHVQKHPDDHISVQLYVEENLQKKKNILLFKRQGEDDLYFPKDIDNPLDNIDFALGIMTDFQRNMFLQFGNNIICADATHGTNYYDFNLITVLVIDEYREGIPVAWLISNKETSVVLKLFFETIKRNLGIISSKIFMSDNASQYYNSWIHVFGGGVKKLLCHWHVHRDWQKQLNKIKNESTSSAVYKCLCLLLEEGDKEKFEMLLKNFLKDLEDDPDTQAFGEYFKKEWISNKEEWAKCYRLNSTINTNMFLESFHKTLKYQDGYFGKKEGRRLDKCISVLLQFSKDLNHKRLIKLEKGKSNKKTTEINKKHLSALRLPQNLISKISDSKWKVKSEKTIDAETTASDNLIYEVTKQAECKSNCKVKCYRCNICLHSYACSCPDGLTSTTICKHIHLVVSSQKQDSAEHQDKSNNEPQLEIEYSNQVDDNIKDSVTGNEHIIFSEFETEDLETIKENLRKKHALLLEKIEKCNNRDLLIASRKCINNANNILDLDLNNSEHTNVEVARPAIANNKNVEKQYRFFSTKKKRKTRSLKYAKPSFEEKCDIENSILGNYCQKNQNDHSYSTTIDASKNVDNQCLVKRDEQRKKLSKAGIKFLQMFSSSEIVQNVIQNKHKIKETEIEVVPEKVPDSVIDTKPNVLQAAKNYVTSDAWLIMSNVMDLKKKAWSCALCTNVTTTESMICCDSCEKWFHWKCQELKKNPTQKEWHCNKCVT